MSKQRYYNTTDSPVTMDAAGHILGGGEFGTFDGSHQIALALASGKLVHKRPVEEPEEPEDGDAEPNMGEMINTDEQPPAPEPKPSGKKTRNQKTESQEK